MRSATPRTIVITDDDQTIHYLWEAKLSCLRNVEENTQPHPEIVHLDSVASLKAWTKNHPDLVFDTLFLVDYELGSAATGLDAIEELNLQKQAVLVTSCSDEKKLQERCAKDGVPLIGKKVLPSLKLDFITLRG